jgi:hypothetical protein
VVDGTGRRFGFHYNIIGIAPDFRADNGFVPRVGYVQPSISNRWTLYGKPGSTFERFTVFHTFNGLWQYDDFFSTKSLLEDRASMSASLTVRGGWSVSLNPRVSSYAFNPRDYTFKPSERIESLVSGLSIASPQFQTFTASAGVTAGNDVDFLETSRVRRLDYNASLDLRPMPRLRVSATYVSSSFTRRSDDEQTAFTRIPRIKVEYQVARPVFVRVISQYSASRREPLRDPRTGQIILVSSGGVLVPSTRSVSNALRTDWLFSFRPAPGTVFFLGYGGSLSEPDPLAFQQLRRVNDSFFIKGSYVLRIPIV